MIVSNKKYLLRPFTHAPLQLCFFSPFSHGSILDIGKGANALVHTWVTWPCKPPSAF